jgi:ribosomal protein S18 acetylase RimI-like enzyme
MSEIEIIRASSDDWQSLRDIRLKALQTDPTAFGRSYEEEAGNTEEEWRARLEASNRKTYLAKLDGKVVGIGGAKHETGVRTEHMATVIAIFVDPVVRGQQVGSQIMARIMEDLHKDPKVTKVRLSVNEEQAAAKKMYEKFGFKEVGKAKNEIKIGDKYYDQSQMELIFEDKL